MSYFLKQIIGDSDEEEEEEYFEDDEEDQNEMSSPQNMEDMEGDSYDIIVEQKRANLTFKNQSERKQERKHKHSKSKVIHRVNDQHHGDDQVLEISEEEMNHYQQLKLYGINGPPKKYEGEVNEEINFKLDVLQSSKMFFEVIQPKIVTVYSGSRNYDSQIRYLYQNSFQIRKEKGYKSDDEMFKAEMNYPRLAVNVLTRSKSLEYVQQVMNRSEHLSCLSSDSRYLFVLGGKNQNGPRDDFVIYDTQSGNMSVFINLHLASHLLNYQRSNIVVSPLCGYGMFEYGGVVYIFGTENGSSKSCIYTLKNGLKDPLQVEYGVFMGNSWIYGYGLTNNLFPARSYFSISYLQSTSLEVLDVYIFGGKCSSKAVDDMIVLRFPFDANHNNFRFTRLDKPKMGDWPAARFFHSSCMIANLIFIYGGMNNRNQLLNDLYMFDTTTNVWTEISVESMLPPPLFKHQSFAVNNQSFYIYGGQQLQESSSSLFRFDIVDKKWSLIEIISDERNTKLASHQCLVVHNKLYVIGGNTEQKIGDGQSTFNALLNINDPGKPIPICNYLSNKRKEGYLCDVVLRVKDKAADSISFILAHRCILKARCSYLTEKMVKSNEIADSQQFEGTFLSDNIVLIDIYECHTHILEKYIEYLYTGSLYLDNLEQVNQFLNFVKLVSKEKHYPSIQNICTIDTRTDLGLTKQILNEMHKDLITLIDDNTYSDIIVVLDRENQFEEPPVTVGDEDLDQNEILSPLTSSSVPSSGIAVHRLIMSRSPFFSRMLVTSGMMETREKVVHLSDYSKEVMLELLKYLYTDIIHLSSRNCLGILVYSLMFDLVDLASCCRRMVISLLDNSTVWTVHEIAVLYNEKILEGACEHYIANNYASLNNSSGFLDLPDMTRIKIKQISERKTIKKK